MLAYFVLIVLDNLLDWHGNKESGKRRLTHIEDADRSPQGKQDALVKPTNTGVTAQGEMIRLRLVEVPHVEQDSRRKVGDPQSSRSGNQ